MNGELWDLHKTVSCEGALKLEYVGTKNVGGDLLNPKLGYAMVRLYNQNNTCQIGVTVYKIF